MNKVITFRYYGSNMLGRWIICTRLASLFSHVAVKFDSDVYQATMIKGVHKVAACDVRDHVYEHSVVVTEEEYNAALAYAESKLGQTYDFKAIVGFILGSLSQSKGNLFCSEYGYSIFNTFSGIDIRMFNLVSPGQLRLIISTWMATRNKT